jgi:hypothetical protein
MRLRNDRIGLFVLLAGIALASLTLVILSPFALQALISIHHVNWLTLSNVGQTYGAVSALLAALALVGVALSVLLQVREARHNRVDAGRTRHYELVRMVMDNPLYFQAEAKLDISVDMRRLIAYINLRVQFWQMLWEFDELPEVELRESLAAGIFAASAGRYYWEQFGEARTKYNAGTRRERRLHKVLDEEYRKAVASGPPNDFGSGVVEPRRVQEHRLAVAKAGSALAVAALVGAVIDRFSLARMRGTRRRS